MTQFKCLSPIDGSLVHEGALHGAPDINRALSAAVAAQAKWKAMPLAERISILQRAITHLYDSREEIGVEITRQMGRPVRYTAGELGGVKERGEMMLALAPKALADIEAETKEGFTRKIKREALGVVAVLAPWNYPFLTSVNAIIPALVAGNAVTLKHSAQTPLVALRYAEAFKHSGLPDDVFQILFLNHAGAASLMGDARVDYVAFTGSVGGGHAVTQAISDKFIGAGLELGGKDPAYIRADTDPVNAAINLADGAFFNSGQSCCGIERIYVDQSHFDVVVETVVSEAKALVLGDPMKPETTLGPMASVKGADSVRDFIKDAIAAGAKAHLPLDENWGSAYLGPQVLTNVTHEMGVMTEECFGPVVGIMATATDAEAIALMNDSDYGLTASIWTNDADAAEAIGDQLETGTVFLNRCDYLDPELAWTGVKNSGRGATLSKLGFEHLTRPKSYHFKLPPTA
ncbi:MAG: aldehyde dehydrogenase family protein [Maricaulaceae bacterium]